jgi:hypothetical protein
MSSAAARLAAQACFYRLVACLRLILNEARRCTTPSHLIHEPSSEFGTDVDSAFIKLVAWQMPLIDDGFLPNNRSVID